MQKERLLLQLRRPVEHQTERRWSFFPSGDTHQKFLSVWKRIVAVVETVRLGLEKRAKRDHL